MQEIRELLTTVMTTKRKLKQIYYTTRNEETKADSKQLVVAAIGVQRIIENLMKAFKQSRTAKRVLNDRKAIMTLRRWSIGLPRRLKDYGSKHRKLDQEHLRRFKSVLLDYLQDMGTQLAAWENDIVTMKELPKMPRD
jgi:hypothetical protein